jgi:DNA-binding NtrC family response regulator
VIEPAHLRLEPPVRSGPTLADVVDLSGPLPEVAKRVAARAEEEAIALALGETDGDRAAAAERLGISLSTLNRRLRKTEDVAES